MVLVNFSLNDCKAIFAISAGADDVGSVSDGAEVLATSRSDYSTLAEELGVKFFTTVEQFAQQLLDVVIFSVSILSFHNSLKHFPFHLLQDSLIVDVLSVKTHPKVPSFIILFLNPSKSFSLKSIIRMHILTQGPI